MLRSARRTKGEGEGKEVGGTGPREKGREMEGGEKGGGGGRSEKEGSRGGTGGRGIGGVGFLRRGEDPLGGGVGKTVRGGVR